MMILHGFSQRVVRGLPFFSQLIVRALCVPFNAVGGKAHEQSQKPDKPGKMKMSCGIFARCGNFGFPLEKRKIFGAGENRK